MKKIVITGPESTGKTTLANQLAAHYHTQAVPEYARTYLAQLDRPYVETDLLPIAKGQLQLFQKSEYQKGAYQICDTGFLVLKIWLAFKYGRRHPLIDALYQQHQPDLYLLCDIDLNWTFDPIRENPILKDREVLMEMYRSQLEASGFRFALISGQGEMRLKMALEAIDGLT